MRIHYDLTAFKDMPTEEFQEWVLEECVGENVEEDTSQLSSKETILFDIVYRTYQNEGVGKAISCRYKDGEWIVVDLEETWRS